ncbi:hypothetical protein [Rhodococcus sp. (in: high G+C Gram-positive bacteria)]|uniref:hypothetical protein n=1 Tax=Rhodococcus sp. TaxID=1831 RepID=UPI003BB63978
MYRNGSSTTSTTTPGSLSRSVVMSSNPHDGAARYNIAFSADLHGAPCHVPRPSLPINERGPVESLASLRCTPTAVPWSS